MFCPNCGTEQLKGTTFCNVCGGELPKISELSENVFHSPYYDDLPNKNLNQAQIKPNQYPNQMQYMDMQQMQYPNQMQNMGMQQMQYPNQMQNMGMPIQYPNQMPMGMPNQQININITHEHKKSSKNKILAAILAFLFGGFGAHKFYLGKSGWGLLYLLTFWTGIPYCLSIIEGIMYLCTSDDDWNRKY